MSEENNNKYNNLPIEVIDFSQKMYFGKEKKQLPAFVSLSNIEILDNEDNHITLEPGDILVRTEKNLITINGKNNKYKVSPPNKYETKDVFENWVKNNLHEEIVDESELIEMITIQNVKRKDPLVSSQPENQIFDLKNSKEKKRIEDYTVRELLEARNYNIDLWNKIRKNNKDDKFSTTYIIQGIRKQLIIAEIKYLIKRTQELQNKADELSVIVDNNDNPLKVLKDWFNSEQNKLMSAKEAKRKLNSVQKEIDSVQKRLESLKMININKPTSQDKEEINKIINKRKDAYQERISNIIPGFHPKYHFSLKRISSNLEIIESEINTRLQSYALSNLNEKKEKIENNNPNLSF
jgi:hypothetical protein